MSGVDLTRSRHTTMQAFAERIQTLADDYQVRLPLNYQPLRQWEGQASEGGEGKRREMEPSQKHTSSSGGGTESSKTRKKSNVGVKGRHTQAKEQVHSHRREIVLHLPQRMHAPASRDLHTAA